MMIDSSASDGADLPAPRGRLLGPRFSPGPLRVVKHAGPSGAAKGAVVGGLVGLAVLAAFSLPLVLAQVDTRPSQWQAEAPQPSHARAAAVSVPKPVPAETASIAPAPAAFEPPVAPAAKSDGRTSPRSALSLDSLPTLTQDAADIDLEPVSAAPPPAPRQPQKPVAQRRAAPPKP